MSFRTLRQDERETLRQQGCTSSDWSTVTVDDGWDIASVHRVRFEGTVRLGKGGPDGRGRLHDATLSDCSVGDGVRIDRIGTRIEGYDIADDVVIENVAEIVARKDATFGTGSTVETVNEAGGREIVLHAGLTAQTAWLQAFRRHDRDLQKKLSSFALTSVGVNERERGVIESGATIRHCGPLRNVRIGPCASVDGAALLEEVTILSCAQHPTKIGTGVRARWCVIAEGAEVSGGVILDRVFIGQAVKAGKQFSAENSLFFANSEIFHGEAVAVFGGPYTVTHHKSTLLIAGLYSFYNAGSGTNQSNHMYKLGPVHQGIFERGSKTGSFSYVLHETHVGAFSVVIGKHYTNINTPDLPFSYIHESEGQSQIVPGMNLFSVGTVRDGEKWPKRDGRKAPQKRDLIIFDVFSPYTVEKMRRGRDLLRKLHEITPKEKSAVQLGGVLVKRLLLKKCAKYYSQAITRYLAGEVLRRLDEKLKDKISWRDACAGLKKQDLFANPMAWVDVAGLLIPAESLLALEEKIRSGDLKDHGSLVEEFGRLHDRYRSFEWEYVAAAFKEEKGNAPETITPAGAEELLDEYVEATESLQNMVLDDARKEYDAFARIGFGLGGDEDVAAREFENVRGSTTTNGVIGRLTAQKEELAAWSRELRKRFAAAK